MATKTIIVGGQYKVTHVISHAGSYGKVLGAVHKETLQPYAIKVGDNAKGTMANEIIIYNFLNKHLNTHFTAHGDNTIKINDIKSEKSGGWPTVHASGQDGKFTYIVMDIMGPALEQNLSAFIGQPMTVITAGLQMLQLIQKLHDKGVVHGDIKPDNFVYETAEELNKIQLLDFGLSHIMSNPPPYAHIIGSPRYASVRVLEGEFPTKCDDLESLGYLLIYLLKGHLPWQQNKNCSTTNTLPDDKDFVAIKKAYVYDPTIPGEFLLWVNYCRSLSPLINPINQGHYTYLKLLLLNLYKALQHHK